MPKRLWAVIITIVNHIFKVCIIIFKLASCDLLTFLLSQVGNSTCWSWGLGITSESRIAMLVVIFLAVFFAEKTAIFFAAKNAAFKTSG